MIELLEKTSVDISMKDVGKIAFSRKGGQPRIFIKSPLLESFFRDLSNGKVINDPVFGVKLYGIRLDEKVSQDFWDETGVSFSEGSTLYGTTAKGTTWFNMGFIRAVGAGEGISIPINTLFPVKFLEDGSFATAMRKGLNKLLREFVCDFDFSLDFAVRKTF